MERWLSGEMSGHFGPFMYTDDADDHRWKEGHSGETYYLGRDDKATFDIMLRELDIEVENFFDLGPGGTASVTSKSLPMLARIKAKRYLPVDLSTIMAQGALDLTRARLGIDGTPLIADFFEPMAARLPRWLVGLPGGTVGDHRNT